MSLVVNVLKKEKEKNKKLTLQKHEKKVHMQKKTKKKIQKYHACYTPQLKTISKNTCLMLDK